MSGKPKVKIRPREEYLHRKWAEGVDEALTGEVQHSFDSLQRQEDFVNSFFETEDELKRYYRYRSEWHRRSGELDAGDAPLSVCCELVSFCNLSCPMCYSITEEFQAQAVGAQRQMPWKTVKKIIDECAELEIPSMLFSWRGESTLYRWKDDKGDIWAFPDVLAYARKKGILEITSLTNGQMISEEMAKAIAESEPSWISVSIDGMEEEYNKIRTPSHKNGTGYNAFGEAVRNIKNIIRFRDGRKKRRPQIRTNTVFPPISKDPMKYYNYLKDIGIGWVTVNEILDFRGKGLPDDAIVKDWVCRYPFQRLTISANGSILPCTGAHNEEKELLLGRYPGSQLKKVTKNGETEIIELPERTIKDTWHCEELERIRFMHKTLRRCEIWGCRNCRHGAVRHGVEWIPDDWDMETMKWKGREWRE